MEAINFCRRKKYSIIFLRSRRHEIMLFNFFIDYITLALEAKYRVTQGRIKYYP